MGGDARSLILPLPIGGRGVSSWAQHQRRSPRSTEPGTDIFAETGTPVLAPADGVIYGYGESVIPATGRWVGIDFDNGMSFRCMHHSRILRKGGRVRQGDEIALSGSSGYGSDFFGRSSRDDAFWRDTGGDHSHVTLWPTRDKRFGYGRDGDPNKPYTIDIMDFIRLDSLAGGGATPIPTEEEELMGVADDIVADLTKKINAVSAQVSSLDTRRDTAIVWVEGNAFVVDDAAGTKWNVARGQATIEDAFKFIGFLRDRGFVEYANQAPYVLAGYRDVTEEGSIRDEVRAALAGLEPKP